MKNHDLPDEMVKVTISGKVLDMEYARLFAMNKDLALDEIILLDKVQKKLPITEFEEKILQSKKLIEGIKSNFYVSASVAKATGKMDQYIKNRSFDDRYFKNMILEFIRKNKQTTKEEIDTLLLDKLPAVLDEQQQKNKLRNLMYALSKKEKSIENQGTSRYPIWK